MPQLTREQVEQFGLKGNGGSEFIKKLAADLIEAWKTIDDARNFNPFSAVGCVLCLYEDGALQKQCNHCEQYERLLAEMEELKVSMKKKREACLTAIDKRQAVLKDSLNSGMSPINGAFGHRISELDIIKSAIGALLVETAL